MSKTRTATGIPPEIATLLRRLRWRIRAYVWLEGLSVAAVWLCATFWVGLALDYLPVLAGVGEMPRPARLVLLVLISVVFLVILYRWLLRRIFARLADRSMAILLERRFRQFGDSLITSVELDGGQVPETDIGREMLNETRREALTQLPAVRLSEVFNFRPLAVSLSMAGILAITMAAFYVVNGSAFELGVDRLYLLSDQKWPRRAKIEVVGVELRQAGTSVGDGKVMPFEGSSLKAAKGSSLGLVVRADASQAIVPKVCVVHYRTQDGDRGRVNMTSVGRVRDGYRYYKYDGKPFDGILTDIEFEVVGFDHRVGGHSIQVVDSPTLVDVKLACEFPPYMVDVELSQRLPRTVDYTAGLQLPQGTKFKLICRANKPLTRVDLTNPDNPSEAQTVAVQSGDETSFEYQVASLGDHWTLDVSLTDSDRVQSERPYRIHVAGIEDAAPAIDMRLQGIGTAITPDAMIPIQGKILDDYGVAKSWVDVAINEGDPVQMPFAATAAGEAQTSIDFRVQRAQEGGLSIKAQDKLQIVVKATDKRELGDGPNEASGDRHELEVVTADQLLAMLEARELGLRRRFEQIIEEMTQAREMLVRIKTDGPEQVASRDVEEAADEDESPSKELSEDPLQRAWSLRLLRARQSLMQAQKSAQEVLGVAAAFREIRDELVNNRVDTSDRKLRLEEQIATPLHETGTNQFPELERRIEQLAQAITVVEQKSAFQKEDAATIAAADQAVDQAELVLRELDSVLQKMLDLESFNELLDIVRSLIDDQEALMSEVKKEQKKSVLELLK